MKSKQKSISILKRMKLSNESYLPIDSIVLEPLKAFAQAHDVPIIKDQGLRFLQQLILIKDAQSVLEIGTAIGYSALGMLAVKPELKIVTVERDPNMQVLARKNFESFGKKASVQLICEDALNYLPDPSQRFDMIFIDAAKAQSQRFFERFERFLHPGGVIVVDNLDFHGLVGSKPSSKNVRRLVEKIEAFIEYVQKREAYDTVIYPIGDGMSVSIKKR